MSINKIQAEDADFAIENVEQHPSGAFGIQLKNGYLIAGVQEGNHIRISRDIMEPVGGGDVAVFFEVDKPTKTLGPNLDDPHKCRGVQNRYSTHCVSSEQADFLNDFLQVPIDTPITHLRERTRNLYIQILGQLELDEVRSRHLKDNLSLIGYSLTYPFSIPFALKNGVHPLAAFRMPLYLLSSIMDVTLFRSYVDGLRVKNQERLYRSDKPKSENSLLISDLRIPTKWNPDKFGDVTSVKGVAGFLRGNLEGIELSEYSVDYLPNKELGIEYYKNGGYFMEITPDEAGEIRKSPGLSAQTWGKFRAMRKALPDKVLSILQEANLL